MPAEDLRLRTPAGVPLAAWYLPTRSGAAVVLLHGAGSTRSAVLDQAAVLWRHGYGVLALDARGHGDSSGRAMDFGWYGDDDVRGAVDRLSRLPGVDRDRIGVVGLSMGGEEAVGAAAADRRIAAVVAEGATGRSASDLGWLSDRYGWRGRITELWRGALTYGLTDLLTESSPPVSLRDAVRAASPRPVLLIAAGELPDETSAAAFIAAGSPDTVTTWTVPGAGHTRGSRPGQAHGNVASSDSSTRHCCPTNASIGKVSRSLPRPTQAKGTPDLCSWCAVHLGRSAFVALGLPLGFLDLGRAGSAAPSCSRFRHIHAWDARPANRTPSDRDLALDHHLVNRSGGRVRKLAGDLGLVQHHPATAAVLLFELKIGTEVICPAAPLPHPSHSELRRPAGADFRRRALAPCRLVSPAAHLGSGRLTRAEMRGSAHFAP